MLPGLGVILLVLPLQYFFGYKIIRIKMAWAQHAAKRSGILQETLPAIKLVKYYAWEKYFEDETSKVGRLCTAYRTWAVQHRDVCWPHLMGRAPCRKDKVQTTAPAHSKRPPTHPPTHPITRPLVALRPASASWTWPGGTRS